MDRAYVERNAAHRERLYTLVARLSDDDQARPRAGGWTVAALLAHLVFWDRFILERWTQALREVRRIPPPLGDVLVDLINAVALAGWRALQPRAAAEQALRAAQAVGRLVAGLPAEAVAEVLAAWPVLLLDRTLHGRGHLAEIEAALGGGPGESQ